MWKCEKVEMKNSGNVEKKKGGKLERWKRRRVETNERGIEEKY